MSGPSKHDISKLPAKFQVFSYLTPDELSLVSNMMQQRTFAAGDVVIHQGKKGDGLYFIYEGKVDISIVLPGPNDKKVLGLGRGDCFGEVFFLSQQASAATVTAATALNCFFLDVRFKQALRVLYPQILQRIFRGLTEHHCYFLQEMRQEVAGLVDQLTVRKHKLTSVKFQADTNVSMSSIEHSQTINQLLRRLHSWFGVDETRQQRFLAMTKIFAIARAGLIYQEQDQSDGFYLVLEGAVQAMLMQTSQPVKIEIYGPGTIFGKECLVPALKRITTLVAREPSIVLFMPAKNWQQFASQYPKDWYCCYELLTQQVVQSVWAFDRVYIRLLSLLN